jgi:two-component system, sensor histidine kinase and response regulator
MSFTGIRVKWMIALGLTAVFVAALGWIAVRRQKVEDRVYKIGYEDDPPQHFTGKDGKPAGFAVDLIDEAARRSGIRLQWLLAPESSEAALKAKKVDLWPMMTIRPERKGIFYITDPYREVVECLIVRSGSTFSRVDDLRSATISYDGSPLDLRMLRPRLPKARLTVIESPKQSLEAVCKQRVDAAYLDEYTAIATILGDIGCGGQGLHVIQVPELHSFLGVGATFEARPAADALRKGIGAMAADGTLTEIGSRWRSFSGRNFEIADELTRAQQIEQWLIAGIAGAVLLLMFTLWQAAGIHRALARAKEATELKSQFLANMSHEIRTPMNAILGMTAIAMETPDRKEQQEYLNDVMRSGESLLALLNDILDLSKIEAGRLSFDLIDFDLADVARGVCSLLAEAARGKGLELISRIPEPSPGQVRGDPSRLRQALVNLVGNAIKFTEKGSVELKVTVDAESDSTLALRFAVTDTGVGISEEAQRRIFESFAQADGSVARKYGGTGLGLSISKQLIAKMGGELSVESVLGRGSTFWFVLPFDKAHRAVESTTGEANDLRVSGTE